MKSLFQQSSCIPSAIKKAWKSAGEPTEFTVKILDSGKKSFLGFGGKKAIIQINFAEEKLTTKTNIPVHNNRPLKTPIRQETTLIAGWDDDLKTTISEWLKEMFTIAKLPTSFDMQASSRILNIFVKTQSIATEEKKMFYASLSNLLMQFLRKKHKKRFQGYNIVLKEKKELK
jgi:predicted RNA-binding protein Jag